MMSRSLSLWGPTVRTVLLPCTMLMRRGSTLDAVEVAFNMMWKD